MTADRRYRDDEVAEIFEIAASPSDASRRELSSAEGLTLAQLQEIGREVGVPPERIADAAAKLDFRRDAGPRQRSLGMPIGVARTVDLPRAPTDHEWELLVADLRATFRARGNDQSRGNLRQWTNGNLYALVEPTDNGHRLRLGTVKGDAVAINRAGIAGLMFALMLLVVLLVTGELADDVALPFVLGGISATALGYNGLRLPSWAREREEQMQRIAARALALTGDAAGTEH